MKEESNAAAQGPVSHRSTTSSSWTRHAWRGASLLALTGALGATTTWAALPADPRVFPRFTDVFAEIDHRYGMDALTRSRSGTQNSSFAISIEQGLRRHLSPMTTHLGGNESSFGVNPRQKAPVSLISHPMCEVTAKSLSKTISKVPSADTIALANEFAQRFNSSRENALYSDDVYVRTQAWDQLLILYSRLMGCLAYTESLTTADGTSSIRLASKVSPSGYQRPDGVLFYFDSAQTNPASQLNIGLYQFSPDSRGNVNACIQNWNQAWPRTPFTLPQTNTQLIKLLGDESQFFNAFCGVNKIVQSFNVQVNTSGASRTHSSNLIFNSQGKLAGLQPPENRCVSLHFASWKTYNHFGPLQNSDGKNLRSMLQCTLGR